MERRDAGMWICLVQAVGRESAGLPERAREAEEAGTRLRERWSWVEPVVWTEPA